MTTSTAKRRRSREWRWHREPEPYDWRPGFELLIEESRRTVDRQMTSVREARQRAGNMLGYAAVVAAALGFTADDGLGVFTGIALAGFLIVAGAAMYVLYPRVWHQDLRAARIDEWIGHPDNTGIEHMLRSAAMAHDENYAANLNKVDRLHRGIIVAVGGIVIESVALVLQLVL
jgi:hypothetical protein